MLNTFLEEDNTGGSRWSCAVEMGVFRYRFRIAAKLAAAAENPVTNFPLRPDNQQRHHDGSNPAFYFDYNFDLRTSINMQLDTEMLLVPIA